jgi:IclR family transcriptional regulator, acetate operon repressor
VRVILEADGLPAMTDRTITDIDSYLQELGASRARGYAIDNGENEADGRCVAVPLPRAGLPCAISLSAPASRLPLDDVDAVAEALRKAAAQLADTFGGGAT